MRIAPLFAALALAASSFAAPSLALADDKPIAVVDGKAIPASYGELVKREMTAQGQPDSPELDARVRESLINLELLSKAASAKGLDKDPKMVAVMELRRMDQMAKMFLEDYVKTHPVTEADLKAAYEKVKAGPAFTEFKARHILVKSEAEAKTVLAELGKKGAKFDALAKKFSKDPGSAKNGGDLGWADPSSFVPEFSKAMVALKPGDITKTPVKTQFGFHIIQLDNVRKGEVASFDEMRGDLTKQLGQMRVREAIAEIRAKAKVE